MVTVQASLFREVFHAWNPELCKREIMQNA